MRTSIPTEKIIQAGIGVKINVMRGSRVIAVDIDVDDVKVTSNATRVVPTQITLTAPLGLLPDDPGDPLNNFGQRIQIIAQIEADGVVQSIDYGWYLITSWSEGDDSTSVTALDLMQVLEENPMPWPSSPPSRATLASELRRLCALDGGVSLPVVLDMDDFAIDSTIQWDTSRTTSIQDLCQSYGLEYAVQADGCLHVWEARDGREPVAHYTGETLLIGALRESQERKPNRWVVVGSSGSGDDAQQYIARVENNSAPYDPASYGLVTSRTELSGATSQAAVNAAAQQAMRASLEASTLRSLEIVTDPRLELGDIISVITDAGEPLVGRVVAIVLTLSNSKPSQTMRVDMEVLQW